MQNNSPEPPKSKYWKDMFVHRTLDNPSGNTLVSTDVPVDYEQQYAGLEWECFYPFNQQVCDTIGPNIIQFLNNNNQMYTGIYERVDIGLLQSLTGLNTYVFLLRYPESDKIIGTMLASVFETATKTRFALVSYLCIHKKLRNKSLCMMLIRKALVLGHKHNIVCSYYLEAVPYSIPAIPVERFMRPIHVQNALKNGFEFVMPPTSNKTATKHAYFIGTALPKPYQFHKITSTDDTKRSFQFVSEVNERHPGSLNWIPNTQEWANWCNAPSFDTLIVTKQNNIIGVITVQKKQIYLPETQKTSNVTFIPYHIVTTSATQEDKEEVINAAVIHSKQLKDIVDMMFIFESGDFDKLTIEKNKAVPTGKMFLDFYNYIPQFTKTSIHVPLL